MINIPKKGQKTGYTINCEFCGKEIYQTKTQYNRAKHHFCSNECHKKFEHNLLFEDRECPICNKLFNVSKKSSQRFCSTLCQNEWQKTNIGKNNVRFQGKVKKCDWCGKELVIGKSNIERFNFHFCSNSCRQNWYSNIYSQNDDWREECRIRAAKILKNNKIITQTKPQLIINKLLDSLNIKYINEQNFKYYSMDNYLQEYNLAIEVMGDYWHSNPIIYNSLPTSDIQTKRIRQDRAKHTYIKKYENFEILYLWESDINNNLDLCKNLILLYIKQNGILENYNSFNYILNNINSLELKQNIIYPYFEK